MLKWRAHNILGSSDFLGNPAALASDVSAGFSVLLSEGSVKTLVKNVAHGLTNSTAKFTGNVFFWLFFFATLKITSTRNLYTNHFLYFRISWRRFGPCDHG